MSEDQLKLEARLMALEYVVANVARIALLAINAKPEHAREIRAQAKGIWRRETFEGVPPAMSDHMAAEVEEAVDDLLGEVEKQVTGVWEKVARRAS